VRRLWDEGTTTSGGATWLAIGAGGTVKMETGGGAGRWCLTRWASGVAFGGDTGSDDGGSSGNFLVWWVVNGWVHGGCWVVAVWGCGVADLEVFVAWVTCGFDRSCFAFVCGGLTYDLLEFFWVWLGAGNFLGLVGYGFAEYVGKFGFEWWF
jgi:hypothetical protein